MNEQRASRLKILLASVPPGFYVDSKWLSAQGIRRSSVADYVGAGWLRHVAHGLYQRPGTGPIGERDWRVLALSVQTLMGHPVHVGGMTALQQMGYRHYLSFGAAEQVYLYAPRFPSWLDQALLDAPLHLRKTSLFADAGHGLDGVGDKGSAGDAPREWWDWTLRLSSPERAILEALDELPDGESFHSIDMVFQSLVSLRPRRLMMLLTACRSVKVKRLFFVYADRHAHAWFKHLDRDSLDLGAGDRSLVKGGRLHPTYRITLPQDLMTDNEGSTHGS
ncbi:type IV toxin-antitoxin system AbiEi family antitoxin [Ensifer sp. ENS12]|uniref:type IV toxin-antitoxin system AbiEi family antitoxin n=1 Tax=Ensifer sp. ENS12 TaxID=2854774 RepID=UPI001C46FB9D|nr:type IV toxin-antitoxin system AbiEi family antitoxin [Ensifer sp. ENS12]MBV7521334.1 type IV toxin-antitoxin system AbiEi family antitoxin [Ensifer sp. ENS12]